MYSVKKDIDLLKRTGFSEVAGEGGLFRMADTVPYGREELLVQVRSVNGSPLKDAAAYTMTTYGTIEGRNIRLEFTSTDIRDIVALHMHLCYSAAYRNTTPEIVRKEQKQFWFRDERVCLPFYKEDECSWIGYRAGDVTVLQNPASYYGDLYLKWRREVCELVDELNPPKETREAASPTMSM